MRDTRIKKRNKNGTYSYNKKELKYQLNYGIADLWNKVELNQYQLPIHHCDPIVYPDYIALNTEKGKFHLTKSTAVAFYSFDTTFDKIDGLFSAIYYKDELLLEKYKHIYKNIKFVIGPDYSLFDDIWIYENDYRLFKIRTIMIWFVLEIKAIVIPNAVYLSKEKLPLYLSGFEKCSVMCFSTKSHIRYAADRKRIKEAVEYVVDHFALRTILVYSVCGKDETSLKLFEYAISKGIDVRIIDNTLRQRNMILMKGSVNHE